MSPYHALLASRASFLIYPLHDQLAMPLESMEGVLKGTEQRRGHLDFLSLALELLDQLFLLGDVLLGLRDVAIGLG